MNKNQIWQGIPKKNFSRIWKITVQIKGKFEIVVDRLKLAVGNYFPLLVIRNLTLDLTLFNFIDQFSTGKGTFYEFGDKYIIKVYYKFLLDTNTNKYKRKNNLVYCKNLV